MSDLSDEDIYIEIDRLSCQYAIYQCYECAKTIMQWLGDNNIEGQIVQLKTVCADEEFIISDRAGGDESISNNGRHYGVKVRGLIFDNIATGGMTESQWLADFHCPSEQFTIVELGE